MPRAADASGSSLLPRRFVIPALVVIGACVAVVTWLGVRFAGESAPGGFDRRVDADVSEALAGARGLLDWWVRLGDVEVVLTLCLGLVLICLRLDWWRGMMLAALAPAVAGGVTQFVLKPLVDRHMGSADVYPSGHTTGAFAVAFVAALLLLTHDGRMSRRLRIVLSVLGLMLALGVAAAVVALHFHYTTDTVGGVCVALATVLTLAVALDALGRRRAQPPATSRNRA